MSNRFALVLVAVAVPVAGFFLMKKSSDGKNEVVAVEETKPEKRDFAPIEPEPPAPATDPEPEVTEAAPPARIRHDQVQLDRFSGKPIDEIIATMAAQKQADTGAVTATREPFHDALPVGPFPFAEGAAPRDAELLNQYVSTIEQGLIDEPTLLDRWRVNLAHAALGTYPGGVPEKYLIENLTDSMTPQFPVHFEVAGSVSTGKSFAVADFNSDGRDDLIGNGGTTFLKSFEGEPVNTGLPAADKLYPADFDGDGDVDLFAVRTGGVPNSLWVNEGEGKFVDFTESAGLLAFADTRAAAWADFDHDGKLDLAVGNFDAPLEMYRAVGDGTFEYVSDQWELESVSKITDLASSDLDNDGKADLFATISGEAAKVLLTTTPITGLEWEPMNSTPVFADFDNDGDLDVVIASRSENPERAFATTLVDDNVAALLVRYFQNEGEGKFTDRTGETGLPDIAGATALAVIDLDSDGFEDLVVGTGNGIQNRVFWNRDGYGFREASAASGLGFLEEVTTISDSTEGLILDGTILRSKAPYPTLTIHLEKNSANAKINVVTRDADWVINGFHRVANGYQQTVIGLGDTKSIETIEVIWPEEGTPPSKYFGKEVPPGSKIAIERGGDAVIVLDE